MRIQASDEENEIIELLMDQDRQYFIDHSEATEYRHSYVLASPWRSRIRARLCFA